MEKNKSIHLEVGDIVEYQYRNGNNIVAGIVMDISNDGYCHINWFNLDTDYFPYHYSSLIILSSVNTSETQ